MLTIKDPTTVITKKHPCTPSISVKLDNCLDLYLAENITTPETYPRHTKLPMDGYAIKFVANSSTEQLYKFVGESLAGTNFSGVLGENEVI